MTAPTRAGTGPSAMAMIEFAADGGATLGHRFVPVDAPQLNVMDLAATRGDGVFETISLGGGHAQALEPHLRRFAHSAALLELPPPDLEAWRDAVLAVAAQLGPVDEVSYLRFASVYKNFDAAADFHREIELLSKGLGGAQESQLGQGAASG